MKAHLMHPQQDFAERQDLPRRLDPLWEDLELNTLLRVMADGDEFLFKVAGQALVTEQAIDIETIRYRQEAVADAMKHPEVVREIYRLAVAAIEGKKKSYWSFIGRNPSSTLHGAIDILQMFIVVLEKLRGVAEQRDAQFQSRAFHALFATVRKELDAEYVATVRAHLEALKLDRGILLSAGLGMGNEGTNYMLHQGQRPNWLERLVPKAHEYTFHIDPKDTAGATALGAIRDRGINAVANALAQSMDHIYSFFNMLRTEVAFYVGCANLHAALTRLEAPICFPAPEPTDSLCLHGDGLYDPCLALSMGRSAVGNALDADDKRIIVITGANQGGKSSLLRAIGLAQLMMQAGMFVAATAFSAGLRVSVYTHYKREEDATMKSGKFDEELARMSEIVDQITPDSLLLCNESFAATNEREGSEIAMEVVNALLERRIRVCFVTHLYEFAHGLFERSMPDALFLRAERLEDGTRTFRLIESQPLSTSYGEDLYRQIFSIESST